MRKFVTSLVVAILSFAAVRADALRMLGGLGTQVYFGAALPTPPAQFSSTSSPPAPSKTNRGSYYTPGIGGDASLTLQQALNDAAAATGTKGDVIELHAGKTYTTTSSFTLPARSGTGWIYVISSDVPEIGGSGLPAAGTRVAPSNIPDMASIRSSESNTGGPLISRATGANHYRLVGLDVELVDANSADGVNYYAIKWNNGDTSVSTLASDITIDRCYISGSPSYGVTHAVDLDGIRVELTDSYVVNAFTIGNGDTNAVMAINSTGPYKINDNYLQAIGETTIFGGSDTTLPSASEPSDITITNNTYYKNYFNATGSIVKGSRTLTIAAVSSGTIGIMMLAMDANSHIPSNDYIVAQLSGATGGAGTYELSAAATGTTSGSVAITGVPYGKNMVEFKAGVRVLFDSNYLINAGAAGQARSAFVLTTRDQNGGNPWYALTDFTVTNNVFTNAEYGGINILLEDNTSGGNYNTQPAYRILFRNNLFILSVNDGSNGTSMSLISSNLPGSQSGGGGHGGDLIFDHNTIIATPPNGANSTIGMGGGTLMRLSNCVWSNNIYDLSRYGIEHNGGPSTYAEAISPQCSQAVFVNNVMTGSTDSTLPVRNFRPATKKDVGYTSYGSNTSAGGYALTSESPYHGAGVSGLGLPYTSGGTADGTDIGCNISLLPTS